MALELASCPGTAVMYSSYACCTPCSMLVSSTGGINKGLNFFFAAERIAQPHVLLNQGHKLKMKVS